MRNTCAVHARFMRGLMIYQQGHAPEYGPIYEALFSPIFVDFKGSFNLYLELQYRLRRTLHFSERTRTNYERTEYASVCVREPMETIGASNNFLDVIISAHINKNFVILDNSRIKTRVLRGGGGGESPPPSVKIHMGQKITIENNAYCFQEQ